ncbi:ABC transporter substrate-binding protein [Lampropedia puyangensis]|uniref:ABC transporter substrate-binding protein n=1 Tax=Lampropedia puyangensis TaxID=1330072 RepID=A0A4S8F1T8_9BURK|nr:ABC transporter substrate-binding protein [Lampropedia puyangensis]THU00285.1 ABC transporter substrate-binding protein [Lampropedia puyangensis]
MHPLHRALAPAVLAAVAALCATQTVHAASEVKIGLLSTLSGPGAALGIDTRDGFNLAVKQHNGLLGGIKANVIVVDDQQSPDAAKQTTDRLLKRDKVDFMTGVVFSNIMLAIAPPVFANKTYYISSNAGPSQLAGAQCTPYFFSASYQNDNLHEAVGQTVQDRGFKKVALLAPNYPAGKDALAGFKRYYKGEVAMEAYTPLQQLDYGAELSQMRASGADAVYIFLPGGLGINFIKQFNGAGLGKDMTLFGPGFSADEDVITAVGEPMVGMFNSSLWAHDLDNAANQRFVADFQKEYGRLPTLYAAQGYDAAQLIGSAVQAVGGDLKNKEAIGQALQAAQFESVRGPFKFNTNHYPIQNYYLREVIKDAQGRVTNKLIGTVFENHADAYASACKM